MATETSFRCAHDSNIKLSLELERELWVEMGKKDQRERQTATAACARTKCFFSGASVFNDNSYRFVKDN